MNRGFLHTRSFRRIQFFFSDTDELKIPLRNRKVNVAFEKRAPDLHLVLKKTNIKENAGKVIRFFKTVFELLLITIKSQFLNSLIFQTSL